MADPIEIRASDIVKRPLNLVTGAAKEAAKKGIVAQVKEGLAQFKEIKSLMDELGIDLGDLLGGKKATTPAAMLTPGGAPPQLNAAKQAQLFVKILQMKYGDVTVWECLDNLKNEYGHKRLSDFLK